MPGKEFFEELPQLHGANLWAGLAAFVCLLLFLLAWRWLAPGSERLAAQRAERARTGRMEMLWGDLMFHARDLKQKFVSLAAMSEREPDYTLRRVREIAVEPSPFDEWQKQVDEEKDE